MVSSVGLLAQLHWPVNLSMSSRASFPGATVFQPTVEWLLDWMCTWSSLPFPGSFSNALSPHFSHISVSLRMGISLFFVPVSHNSVCGSHWVRQKPQWLTFYPFVPTWEPAHGLTPSNQHHLMLIKQFLKLSKVLGSCIQFELHVFLIVNGKGPCSGWGGSQLPWSLTHWFTHMKNSPFFKIRILNMNTIGKYYRSVQKCKDYILKYYKGGKL